MARALHYLMDWAKNVHDNYPEESVYCVVDSIYFYELDSELEGIPPFTWPNGDHRSNHEDIFHYLIRTHGKKNCHTSLLLHGWSSNGPEPHLQVDEAKVWRYRGRRYWKIETVLSVIQDYYIQ